MSDDILKRLNAFIEATEPRWKDTEMSMATGLLREVVEYIEDLEDELYNRPV